MGPVATENIFFGRQEQGGKYILVNCNIWITNFPFSKIKALHDDPDPQPQAIDTCTLQEDNMIPVVTVVYCLFPYTVTYFLESQ